MSSERVKPYEERMEKTRLFPICRPICRLSAPDARIRMSWTRSA